MANNFNGIIIGWMLNIVANLPLFLTMTEVAIRICSSNNYRGSCNVKTI